MHAFASGIPFPITKEAPRAEPTIPITRASVMSTFFIRTSVLLRTRYCVNDAKSQQILTKKFRNQPFTTPGFFKLCLPRHVPAPDKRATRGVQDRNRVSSLTFRDPREHAVGADSRASVPLNTPCLNLGRRDVSKLWAARARDNPWTLSAKTPV